MEVQVKRAQAIAKAKDMINGCDELRDWHGEAADKLIEQNAAKHGVEAMLCGLDQMVDEYNKGTLAPDPEGRFDQLSGYWKTKLKKKGKDNPDAWRVERLDCPSARLW